MPQDTTVISFAHSAAQQLGDVGGPEGGKRRGWHVHTSLLLDGASGRAVGLIDQQWWLRPEGQRGKARERKTRRYRDKESFKWEAAMERVSGRLGQAMSRVITVCDREADVYEFLEYNYRKGYRYVVRAERDRAVEEGHGCIWEMMGSQPVLGRMVVDVAQRGGRKARKATITLRSARIKVRPPRRPKGTDLGELETWVVYAVEEDPARGDEALEWMLLTSEPAGDFAGAVRVVKYYTWRWRVEEFHKAWKSGCKVEEQRLQSQDNLMRIATVLAFVAVRLLQLKEWSELQEQAACTRILDDQQWRCLWMSTQKGRTFPEEPPTARWAYYAIARLGGWYDSKRTGRVGWDTMWRGWQELGLRLEGWILALRTLGGDKCD
jgi:hypothetical protein